MKIAIIGCGLIGNKRAMAIGNSTLVACADINLDAAKRFSQKYGGIPYYTDAAELLRSVDFDIVVLATTHDALPRLIRKCLVHKKHVLVEKPAGRFADELKGLQELALANQCKVRIGFNHRYHRSFRKAKEIVNSGVLGDLMFIRGQYGHGGRIGYNKEWRANPSLSGGGELIDQGSHLIDLSRMFLGDFTNIDGFACNYFWNMPVDDNAFLTLRTQKGQTAFLQVSCTEWKNLFNFEIYGKFGKLKLSGLGGSYGIEKIAYYKMLPEMGPPETYIWEYPRPDDSWNVEFEEFLKDIQENRTSTPGLDDAVANLKIINRIYKNSGYDYNS
ncbi:MAG: Gfo/Idh/MocA family oxidoreductase [Bacteroidia bacterium]|nr:Gfo/Idh/MocA family oxidoreductase [Bacteroidia bacterium]